ncbi:TPA: hypothetical protein ACMDS2_003437 [Vibrio parahaemolyticus]|uniref:hypothetical protein n=1 Tax=Vibrio vulnificus TaxID=672 RepID=UPI00307DBCD3|nr:hypothetical protein [Vibrio parahaemolyticus]
MTKSNMNGVKHKFVKSDVRDLEKVSQTAGQVLLANCQFRVVFSGKQTKEVKGA